MRAQDRPPPRGVDWPKVQELGPVPIATHNTAPAPPTAPNDPSARQVDFLAAHPGAFPSEAAPPPPRALPAMLPGLRSPDVTVVGTTIPILLVHVDGCEGRVGSSYVNHAEAHALTRFLHQLGPAWAEDGLSIGVLAPYKGQAELLRQGMDWFNTNRVDWVREDGLIRDDNGLSPVTPSPPWPGRTGGPPFTSGSTRSPRGRAMRLTLC